MKLNKMKKVFYLILLSIFCLTVISCSKEDESSLSDTTDDSSVTLNVSPFVINTKLEGGTIQGSVISQSSSSTLSDVSISFAKSGSDDDNSTTVNTTTDSNGDYSQALTLGTYALTFSKSGYLNETMSATLATDNQTLVVETVKMLSESCTSGTITGTIKDAVNNKPVTGVSLSIRKGLNETSGEVIKTATTSSTGEYTFSSMEAGWYTIETSKTGYIKTDFNILVCGDQTDAIMPNQDTSISTILDDGAMRIVLSWKTNDDLDAHLTGPDNLSGQGHYNAAHGQFHLYYPDSFRNFYYATNNFSCSGCSTSQMSDNVTLDLDSPSAIGSDGGPETITIGAVRDGTYRYYVHNFSSRGTNNTNLAAAETSVKVYCNDNGTTNVTTYNVPNTAGDLWTVYGFNKCGLTLLNEMGSDGSFTVDVFAPKIAEVTPVTTPTGDTTPNYTFSSNEAGNITYGGSCTSSSHTSATADNNTITFNTLSGAGVTGTTYSDCTITVTDSSNNASDPLTVSSFIVDKTGPTLSEVTAVPTPTSDNTSSYTFSSNEAGTITYGGSCSSADNTSIAGNNTITFNELADNTYSNCTITVTDNVNNASSPLSVTSFRIDTTPPSLSETTVVSTPTTDNTPNYTFNSNEAGAITYAGSCTSSSHTSASASNNTITFDTLADGAYSNCKVRVTDSAGNPSSFLDITTFTVAIPPTLAEVTAVPTPSPDNTSSYTFSSTEAGTITYGGSCSSNDNTSVSGNNTITFNELADGTYNNCTIAVTDNTSNTSDNLTVSEFTIGAHKPVLKEITAVPTLTNDNVTRYTFYSTLSGSISYGGSCTSNDNTTVGDNNTTITFNALADNTYSDCTLRVTSAQNVLSDNLSVNSFTIDTTAPSLSVVTPIASATNDTTPNYTFSSNEAGDITYGGSCTRSSHTSASANNNTITFNTLSGGAGTNYSDCTITVTDNASNASSTLSVNSFTIDTVIPTLSQVTAVPTPDNDSTPDYTFSSSEAGTITYTGDCSSTDNTSDSGNNTITFNALSDGTHNNCKIKVTDNASNESSLLSVNSFIVGATTPALKEVTAVPTPRSDNTPSYTFYSTLSGSITYGGGCGSSTSNASAGNNTITFDALSDNTYNCTITVTNNSNTSSALSVNSFTIDTTAPSLSTVTISSNNSKNTAKAKVGNTITLSITSAEATEAYNVTIAGGNATETRISGTSWRATYNMPSSYSEGAVSFSIDFTDLSGNAASTVTATTNGSAVQFDKTAPSLSQVTAVTAQTGDTTPDYTFSSNEAGTIAVGGNCNSDNNTAINGNNTITFGTTSALSGGTYNNCTITVTDNADNPSSTLSVSSFSIDTTPPTLSEVTAVANPTADSTPDYTFSSSEAGTITYTGDCSSTDNTSDSGNNTITFNALSDGTHNNCKIKVTDNASNESSLLSVNSFIVGATTPALKEVTAVPTPRSDNTPSYTFYSTLSGSITYGGGCGSSTSNASAGNNTITFDALSDNTYNCTITVTNNSNTSSALSVNSFTVDTTAPSLSEVTAISTRTNDNTPSYTFSSNEAGDITYGGSCSSSSQTSASASNNTITFNTLSGAGVTGTTYSNCTITVTDNASNTSSTLSVNSFTIDSTAPTLSQVTVVTTPTKDNTPSYTFSSNEAGTITYGGSCSSTDNTSVNGNNEITFNALSDNTYNNCRITVTDNVSNASSPLTVSSFKIDTTAPTLAEVTAVTSPTNDTTPDYIFSSNEAGTITVGGACNSSNTNATASNNTIAFGTTSALVDNTSYGNCTIRVTDTANNPSSALSVTSFTIDTTAPTLSSTSPAENERSIAITDNISITFSESMSAASVTTNTSNTSCSGSFQLSSDSFSSCIQMASSPSSSDNTTFSITPSPKPFYSTTYKIRVTTGAEDSAGNNIASQYTQTYGFGTSTTFPTTAGTEHTCTILENSSVKCWGANTYGQLGLGDTNSRGDAGSEMGANLETVDLGTGRTAKAIAASWYGTCAILDNSSIKCWGRNNDGQLGLGDTNNRGDGADEMGDNLDTVDLGSGRTATAIAGGGEHYCAILDNASIKCWGWNNKGQLGIGSTDDRGDGADEMGDNLSPIDLGTGRTATAIAAGGYHSCAILDNAAVKCWGRNNRGQLGLGDMINRGDGDDMGDNLNAVDLGTGRTAVSITAGALHTCALLDDYSVKCWGDSSYGQMGTGKTFNLGDGAGEMGDSLTAIDLGSGRTATAIAASLATCAVLDNSSIKCWGANTFGQLGLGDTTMRGNTVQGDGSSQMGDNLPSIDLGTGRTARGVITGNYHTCTIMDNSSIKCWGKNNSGQLGIGDTNNRGDASGEMGDNLPSISF